MITAGNGDIGYIVDVDPEAGELVASFGGRSVTYGFGVPRWPEEGHCHRGSQRIGPATLVEARRVAPCRRALPIVEFVEG